LFLLFPGLMMRRDGAMSRERVHRTHASSFSAGLSLPLFHSRRILVEKLGGLSFPLMDFPLRREFMEARSAGQNSPTPRFFFPPPVFRTGPAYVFVHFLGISDLPSLLEVLRETLRCPSQPFRSSFFSGSSCLVCPRFFPWLAFSLFFPMRRFFFPLRQDHWSESARQSLARTLASFGPPSLDQPLAPHFRRFPPKD